MEAPRCFGPGKVVRWRRAGGLLLAEVVVAPGSRCPCLARTAAHFVLVLKGAFLESLGARTSRYERGALLFSGVGDERARAAGPSGATCLIVQMDHAWYAGARQSARVLTESSWFRGGFVVHLAQRLYGEFRLRDEVSRLAIESLALGVLAEASRQTARRAAPRVPRWLSVVRCLIDERFKERLPLAAIAALAGVHPVHLARSFRGAYSTTVGGHIRRLRVEFACQELATSVASLSEIAIAAGFCDQSHLTRAFKRHTGLTPAAYRIVFQR